MRGNTLEQISYIYNPLEKTIPLVKFGQLGNPGVGGTRLKGRASVFFLQCYLHWKLSVCPLLPYSQQLYHFGVLCLLFCLFQC
jgi:hypothetical protein